MFLSYKTISQLIAELLVIKKAESFLTRLSLQWRLQIKKNYLLIDTIPSSLAQHKCSKKEYIFKKCFKKITDCTIAKKLSIPL